MPGLVDLTGLTFGRLTVISQAPTTTRTRWNAACSCGARTIVFGSALSRGLTKSCGCLRNEKTSTLSNRTLTTHGLSGTAEYAAWAVAKQRCHNSNDKDFRRYGGRGIQMCAEWRESFELFYAHVGQKPSGTMLDRIDNDGNYEPGNVRWVTGIVSANNRRSTAHPISPLLTRDQRGRLRRCS